MKISLLALFLSVSAISAHAEDCSSLAGTWSQKKAEVEASQGPDVNPVVVSIDSACQLSVISGGEQMAQSNVTLDRVFHDNGKFRLQLKFLPGAKDMDGNVIPPMTPEQAKQLQGDFVVSEDNQSFAFSLDLVDKLFRQHTLSDKYYRNQ